MSSASAGGKDSICWVEGNANFMVISWVLNSVVNHT